MADLGVNVPHDYSRQSRAVLYPRPPATPPPPSSRLTLADLTPKGAFLVPDSGSNGGNLTYGSGLTLRYLGGTPYLFMNDFDYSNMCQVGIPADGSLTTAAPFPSGTFVRSWGDIYQSKLVGLRDDGRGGGDVPPYIGPANPTDGLTGHTRNAKFYRDETDQRLYWMRTTSYDSGGAPFISDLCVGYSTLNDAAHTGTGVGMWSIDVPASAGTGGEGNRWVYNMTAIPSSFAATYCGGKRLGIGGGGPPSIFTAGPASMGTALYAIDPPSLGITANQGQLPAFNRLLLHPYHGAFGVPFRMKKPPNLYFQDQGHADAQGDGTHPDYWTWFDAAGYGTIWIHGPNKAGLLVFARCGGGNADSTILASPTPTSTDIFVANPGDVIVGDFCLVGTTGTITMGDYPFATELVTGVAGNHISITQLTYTGVDPSFVGVGTPQAGQLFFVGGRYVGGGQWCSRNVHGAFIYSEATLASGVGVGGAIPTDQVIWDEGSVFQHVGMVYPIPGGGAGTNAGYVSGVALDTNVSPYRLYVHLHWAYQQPQNVPHSIICVYEVNC